MLNRKGSFSGIFNWKNENYYFLSKVNDFRYLSLVCKLYPIPCLFVTDQNTRMCRSDNVWYVYQPRVSLLPMSFGELLYLIIYLFYFLDYLLFSACIFIWILFQLFKQCWAHGRHMLLWFSYIDKVSFVSTNFKVKTLKFRMQSLRICAGDTRADVHS